MKSIIIVVALLLTPSLALGFISYPWQTTYDGVAGGTNVEAVKVIAMQRAHVAAANGCGTDPYSKAPGVQIGQVEPPAECQSVDSVCICTDKLTIFCQAK